MDPDEALKKLREQAESAEWLNSHAEVTDALLDMVEQFKALDDWLANGGFPPAAWV